MPTETSNKNNNKEKKDGGRKRKYNHHPQSHNHSNNNNNNTVRRGGPGVLLTCETGREMKCQREGMEILQYYMNLQSSKTKSNENDEKNETQSGNDLPVDKGTASASGGRVSNLEEELALLRNEQKEGRGVKNKQPQHPDFAVYDTGCRGTVLVLCTRPNCHLIPPSSSTAMMVGKKVVGDGATKNKKENEGTKQDDGDDDDSNKKIESLEPAANKRSKLGDEETSKVLPAGNEANDDDARNYGGNDSDPWDPVTLVDLVFHQASPNFKKGDAELPPSSRFVSRMIPLQATCFASLPAIQVTAKALLQRFLKLNSASPPSPSHIATTTFGICVKRRHCNQLTSQAVINDLAAHVAGPLVPTWKVDLKNPMVKIWIEICCTTAGLAIVDRRQQAAHINDNFNLAEVRGSMS